MGWFNVGSVVGGVLGGIPGAVIGTVANNNANSANANIDAQIGANQMARPNPIDPNSVNLGLDQIDDRLAYKGSSPWANFQLGQQNMLQGQALDNAANAGAGAAAGARTQLAMRGGLSGGARERLAQQGAQNTLMASQDINRQGQINRLGIGAQDAQMNQQNAGLWAQLAAQQGSARAGVAANNYSAAMQAWGANQSANAQLNANKKQGVFGLGIGPL